MVDYRSPALQAPHRKPLPTGNAGLQFHPSDAGTPSPPPQQQQQQQHHHHHPAAPPPPLPRDYGSQAYQHRPRTASSSFLPNSMHPLRQMTPVYPPQPQYNVVVPSRRPSNATTSTTSTGGHPHSSRYMSASQGTVRRSSSSRTASSPAGYVALMRRQKATVWCERSQAEDPREAHQRRVAKQRALLEVQGGGGSGRTSTLASSGKIRHSSATKISPFTTATMVGAGVPLRLSANEIGNADDDWDANGDGSTYHRRTGSGRSSAGSHRFTSGSQRPNQPRLSTSSGNTPPNTEHAEPHFNIPEIVETPAVEKTEAQLGQVPGRDNAGARAQGGSAPEGNNRPSTAQSSESQREEDFGMITEMAAPSGAASAARRHHRAEELKRRGSVDDRTSTMSSVRLFVANPDLSD